jgi:hypothetical protein
MTKRETLTILVLTVSLALMLATPAVGKRPTVAQEDLLVTTPSNFQVDVGTGSVTVMWDPSTSDAEVVIYFVQVDGRWLWTEEPAITLYLPKSRTYTLTVQAQDVDYNRSAWSDPVAFTTPDEFPVTTPSAVQATGAPGSLSVAWEPSSSDAGVLDYLVELRGGSFGMVGKRTSGTTATFDLPAGGDFEVTVTARDTAYRLSDASEPIEVTVESADDWEAPSAPTNLRATFDSHGGPTIIEWNASSGGSGTLTYNIIVVTYGNTPIEHTTQLGMELPDFGECQPGDPQPLTFVVTASANGFESAPSNAITLCFA